MGETALNRGLAHMLNYVSDKDDDMDDALTWLIDPVSRGEFERSFYERALCVVTRDDPGYYQRLLSVDDLDRVLGTHHATVPEVQLVRGADEIPTSSYVDASGHVDPLELASRFDQGATIVFGQLHRRVPALAQLCVSVGQIFGSRVQTNIYCTPPHAQGFRPHWDTHDVFVLQIAGTKRWSIFDTQVRLPLKGQAFDPERQEPGPVREEFELHPGDVAYLPRGLIHAATATDRASVHVTLGLTAFTWTDFLLESVAAAALEDASLREALPLGFADAQDDADRRRLFRDKLATLLGRLDPAPVWRHFEQELVTANTPLVTDVLTTRLQTDGLTLDSNVGRRAGLSVEVGCDAETCVLRFAQRELRLPDRVRAAVEFALTRATFVVRELPDCIDAPGKLTLVRRLIRDGLLRVQPSH